MTGAIEKGRLDRGDGIELAWQRLEGRGPTIVFLPGFRSDMEGSKAVRLAAYAAARGQAMLRLDYSGHGASGGRFEDGTIGQWTQDALRVVEAVTTGPVLLVGSSMGGWIGINLALAIPERVVGFIGIAAAPDFTETLIWTVLDRHERNRLMTEGMIFQPSAYGEPVPITRALIEDGRQHLRLAGPVALHCPVWLLQGQRDAEVPWRTALTIADRIAGDDTRVTFIKDGDHRLSRESDLRLLEDVAGYCLGV
jgi:pimeloyl-ACP methyl ester carboxylesterase